MNAFFNAPEDVVAEMLEGLCRLEPVRLLEDDRGLRVVLRRTFDASKVALLSGGGAGHEPAHAGYVGEGMLTAAVSGQIFASPSVDAVLTGIRHVAGTAGCLVIVKNYTGDRLNFGLAAERARSEGLDVATVRVADDVALPDAPQPRGLAGTVLVHKLAGHLAARGDALEEVRARAQAFADSLSTLGFALGPCRVPGRPAPARPSELGMGIHNEPGARAAEASTAKEAMALVMGPLLAHVDARFGKDAPLVAMLGDLGGCSPQELLVLVNELCRAIGPSRIARLIRPARVMTSLDMRGFSVTLAPADAALIAALDAPTSAPGWPGVVVLHEPERVHVAPDVAARTAREQDAKTADALTRACEALVAARTELDALDARVGDGDAGSTFAGGARAVQGELAAGHLATAEPALLFSDLGALLSRVMGGSSGVLLSILFTAMGNAMSRGAALPDALAFGLVRVQHYGGAQAGDRTMLDALLPASAALAEGGIAEAAAAARVGADATATMSRAVAGRSSYVPEASLLGVVDPGAEAVARALAALDA